MCFKIKIKYVVKHSYDRHLNTLYFYLLDLLRYLFSDIKYYKYIFKLLNYVHNISFSLTSKIFRNLSRSD